MPSAGSRLNSCSARLTARPGLVDLNAASAADAAASGGMRGAETTSTLAGDAAGSARASGNGLLGGATGNARGALGGVTGAASGVGGTVGSSVHGTAAVIGKSPGAVGGLNGAGQLSSGSKGVFGMKGLAIDSASGGTTQGSLITSTTRNVRLDGGTRMLLVSGGSLAPTGNATGDRRGVAAAANAAGDAQSAADVSRESAGQSRTLGATGAASGAATAAGSATRSGTASGTGAGATGSANGTAQGGRSIPARLSVHPGQPRGVRPSKRAHSGLTNGDTCESHAVQFGSSVPCPFRFTPLDSMDGHR